MSTSTPAVITLRRRLDRAFALAADIAPGADIASAATRAADALAAVAKAKSPNDVAAAIGAAADAIDAFLVAVTMAGLGPDEQRDVSTSRGVLRVTANQVRECERAGASLATFAANALRRLRPMRRAL